jgi:hypothetical protein
MIQSVSRVINERTKWVPIPKNLVTPSSPINKTLSEDYSLKQNFFDPTKSSPPNEFMIKLHMRMSRMTREDK